MIEKSREKRKKRGRRDEEWEKNGKQEEWDDESEK